MLERKNPLPPPFLLSAHRRVADETLECLQDKVLGALVTCRGREVARAGDMQACTSTQSPAACSHVTCPHALATCMRWYVTARRQDGHMKRLCDSSAPASPAAASAPASPSAGMRVSASEMSCLARMNSPEMGSRGAGSGCSGMEARGQGGWQRPAKASYPRAATHNRHLASPGAGRRLGYPETRARNLCLDLALQKEPG